MKRRVLITGASSGIGRAIAVRLGKLGCDLVVVGRHAETLHSLVAEIDCDECEIDFIVADVTDSRNWNDIAHALTSARERNSLVFVNCAGLAHFGPYVESAPDAIKNQVSMNMYVPMMLTHAVLPAMLANHGGQIVNILSVAATTTFSGAAAYCASKAGMLAFGRCIAAEYRRQGIRVTNILPGATHTPIWNRSESHPPFDKMLSADAVAQCVVQVVMSPTDRNYDEIHLMPPDGVL